MTAVINSMRHEVDKCYSLTVRHTSVKGQTRADATQANIRKENKKKNNKNKKHGVGVKSGKVVFDGYAVH